MLDYQANPFKNGRNTIIRETLDEMTPEGRRQVDAQVSRLREKFRKKGIRLSQDEALEIIWEMLIFLSDPSQKRRQKKLETYLTRGNGSTRIEKPESPE